MKKAGEVVPAPGEGTATARGLAWLERVGNQLSKSGHLTSWLQVANLNQRGRKFALGDISP